MICQHCRGGGLHQDEMAVYEQSKKKKKRRTVICCLAFTGFIRAIVHNLRVTGVFVSS